jgi:hypothetical protein
MLDVFHPKVNTLFHVSIANDFVDNDTDGAFGDVVDNAGPPASNKSLNQCSCRMKKGHKPMVILVRHPFLLCGIRFDIDNVSYAVSREVGRQFDGAMLCCSG